MFTYFGIRCSLYIEPFRDPGPTRGERRVDIHPPDETIELTKIPCQYSDNPGIAEVSLIAQPLGGVELSGRVYSVEMYFICP